MNKMTTLRLDAVQIHKLDQARGNAAEVLSFIKRHQLKGEALTAMKDIESAVQILEGWICVARQNGQK